jgi:hypothetical protein
MKRMYQYVDLPGHEISREGNNRDKSKFWDTGKWDTFIKPLIPQEALDFAFVDIGTNAGLHLKLAEDMGFRHIYGIEGHPDRIQQANREGNGGRYHLIEKRLDTSFDYDVMPLAGVTLLANVHYYMPIVDFGWLVDRLRYKTLYCIIVSAQRGHLSGKVRYTTEEMRGFFNDWEEIGIVENVDMTGDPSPREGMYGIVFRSRLSTMDVSKWWDTSYQQAIKMKKPRYRKIFEPMDAFYRGIIERSVGDVSKTNLYAYFRERMSHESVVEHLLHKARLCLDIQENGMREPVYINHHKLMDGFSRCCIARALGYKKVLVKYIIPKRL